MQQIICHQCLEILKVDVPESSEIKNLHVESISDNQQIIIAAHREIVDNNEICCNDSGIYVLACFEDKTPYFIRVQRNKVNEYREFSYSWFLENLPFEKYRYSTLPFSAVRQGLSEIPFTNIFLFYGTSLNIKEFDYSCITIEDHLDKDEICAKRNNNLKTDDNFHDTPNPQINVVTTQPRPFYTQLPQSDTHNRFTSENTNNNTSHHCCICFWENCGDLSSAFTVLEEVPSCPDCSCLDCSCNICSDDSCCENFCKICDVLTAFVALND